MNNIVLDYDPAVQEQLKNADAEVSPGLWEGDIAGLSPDVNIFSFSPSCTRETLQQPITFYRLSHTTLGVWG